MREEKKVEALTSCEVIRNGMYIGKAEQPVGKIVKLTEKQMKGFVGKVQKVKSEAEIKASTPANLNKMESDLDEAYDALDVAKAENADLKTKLATAATTATTATAAIDKAAADFKTATAAIDKAAADFKALKAENADLKTKLADSKKA